MSGGGPIGSSEVPAQEENGAYQRQLELFSKCSQEKSIELVLAGEVISQLESTADFLDIGAGTGNLTAIISTFFKDTTVVEPNKKQADHFRRRYPQFHVYDEKWETADLSPKLFDFIFCSHVLYYIPTEQWLDIVKKMYAYLKEMGALALFSSLRPATWLGSSESFPDMMFQ